MIFTNLFVMMEDLASWASRRGAACLCADNPAAGSFGYVVWYVGPSGIEVKKLWEMNLTDIKMSCPDLANVMGCGLGGEAQMRVKIARAAESGTLAAALDEHALSCGNCAAESVHGQ